MGEKRIFTLWRWKIIPRETFEEAPLKPTKASGFFPGGDPNFLLGANKIGAATNRIRGVFPPGLFEKPLGGGPPL